MSNPTATLKGKTILMSGGSRGIGLAIALRAARDGANIAILAKTAEPHAHLEGTVHTAVQEINDAGGRGLAIVGDVRNDDDIQHAVDATVEEFGGIDIVINNASAINLSSTPALDMKRFDLMHQINMRGAFALPKTAYPHLKKAENPHILTLSPPLNLDPKWAGAHLGYTMAKYGMSMTTLGFAAEFAADGIAANSLWPASLIHTAAIENLPGGEAMLSGARTPDIVADAAHHMLTQPSRTFTGQFLTDEEALSDAGVTDLSSYAINPDHPLTADIFLTQDRMPKGSISPIPGGVTSLISGE